MSGQESAFRRRIGRVIASTSAVLSILSFFFLDLDLIIAKLGFGRPNNGGREISITEGSQHRHLEKKGYELEKERIVPDSTAIRPRPAPYGVDDHTIALWTFDEDHNTFVSDSLGSNDGRAIGGVTLAPGRFGMARKFAGEGVGSYLEIPSNSSLNVSQAISIEIWVLPRSFDLGSWNQSEELLNKGGHWHLSGRNRYGMSVTRNGSRPDGSTDELTSIKFAFEISEWSTNDEAPCACAVSSIWHEPDHWYFVVGTYDGTRARLYVNGQLEAQSEEFVGLTTDNDEPLFINNHTFFEGTAQSSGRMGGLIDEVRISNIARTGEEIEAVYRNSRGPGV